ncbi:hemerythrin domain-containing protein [Actinoallomurus acaciae]|uniref:Hemerythrin domain-containing protein n=1 Tax=Actinoallomurus acaciae TaxID=502577 RepID=A0ABV5YPW2_9ACTN
MIDLTLMYAAHDAFRRDLDRLTSVAATGEVGSREVRAGRDGFRRFLTVHHEAEDAVLRAKPSERPQDPRLLDDMEDEHAELDPSSRRSARPSPPVTRSRCAGTATCWPAASPHTSTTRRRTRCR